MENYRDGKRSHRKCSACGEQIHFGKMTAHIGSYICWCAVQEKKGLLTYTFGTFPSCGRNTLTYFAEVTYSKENGGHGLATAYACSKEKFHALTVLNRYHATTWISGGSREELLEKMLPAATKVLNQTEVDNLQFQLELME